MLENELSLEKAAGCIAHKVYIYIEEVSAKTISFGIIRKDKFQMKVFAF